VSQSVRGYLSELPRHAAVGILERLDGAQCPLPLGGVEEGRGVDEPDDLVENVTYCDR
jgi:hypothetical protein